VNIELTNDQRMTDKRLTKDLTKET